MLGRERLREKDATLSSLGNEPAPNVPAIARGPGLQPLGDFVIRGVRAFFTPMRAFATRKAWLFASFVAALLAGKLSATFSANKMILQVLMVEPTIGQTVVMAATVIALGFFNLKALEITTRGRAESDQLLLRFLESPHVPSAAKQNLLAKLKDDHPSFRP